jgi:putative MATE family efflux protein
MKDLTTGKPIKVIWFYALPMIIGQIAQQLYSFFDSAIVGNYISPLALGAVGATSVVSNMLIGFMNSATLGLAIPIARYFGAKDFKNMRKCIGVSALLTMGTAIVLTVASLLGIYKLLVLLGTPDELIGMSYEYVKIILAGLIFTAIYNFCANLLRAVGDSKTPLIFLSISVVLNIVLDLTFIRVFNMGVGGAALATIISQLVSDICCVIYIWRKCSFLVPKHDEFSVNKENFRDLVLTALSMGFMSCIVNIGTVILQSAINGLGSNIITAHTAARKVFDIFTVMLYIVGNAVTTFVSQNIGAGRIDRVKQGVRDGIILNYIITTVLVIVSWIISPWLLSLVAGTHDAAIIDPAVRYIRISVSCFYVLAPVFVLRCSMQGMGRKLVPLASSTIEMVGKILAVMLLTPRLGYLGVTITEPIIWLCCTLMLSIMYVANPPEKCIKKLQEYK